MVIMFNHCKAFVVICFFFLSSQQESIANEITNSKAKNGISKVGPRDLETLYTRPSAANHLNSTGDGAEGGVGGGARGKKPKGRTGWPQHVWAQELKPEQAEVKGSWETAGVVCSAVAWSVVS